MKIGSRRQEGEDFELNIVPVLDSLVVMIAFLLLSSTYANILLLDATVPSVIVRAIDKSRSEMDEFKIELEVTDKELSLSVKKNKKSIARTGADAYKQLHSLLVETKKQFPDRFSIDINIKTDLDYGQITKLMDETRNLWPEDGTLEIEGKKHKLLFPDMVLVGVGA